MKPRAEYLEANNLSRINHGWPRGLVATTWYAEKEEGRTGLAANKRTMLVRTDMLSNKSPGPLRSPTPSRVWVSEHGSSSTQLPEAPDPCPFFIPDHIPGAPNLIPYGRLISLAEMRQAMGYRQ